MDSRLKNRLSYLDWNFDLPGVKGYMPINQQQSSEYSIIHRLQNLLPKPPVIILTGI